MFRLKGVLTQKGAIAANCTWAGRLVEFEMGMEHDPPFAHHIDVLFDDDSPVALGRVLSIGPEGIVPLPETAALILPPEIDKAYLKARRDKNRTAFEYAQNRLLLDDKRRTAHLDDSDVKILSQEERYALNAVKSALLEANNLIFHILGCGEIEHPEVGATRADREWGDIEL